MSPQERKSKLSNILSSEKIKYYLSITEKALAKAKIIAPERSFLCTIANDFFTMARSYHEDARHFFEKGDYINAFGCVNYAHGWLDAGARLGLFDVGGDDNLFTLSE